MTTITIENYKIEVLVTHYFPGDPGKINGPPENCYPPEPSEIEYEIVTETNLEELGAQLIYEKYGDTLDEIVEEAYLEDHCDY